MQLQLHSLLILASNSALADGTGADALLCDSAPTTGTQTAGSVFLKVRDESEAQLRALLRQRPAGVILTDCRSGAEVQRLDVLLSVAEAEESVPLGQTRVLAVTDGLLPAPLSPDGFAGKSQRLCGLVWDWRALATTLGASRCRDADGRWSEAFACARAATLMAAKAAGVCAYDVAGAPPVSDFADECRIARADGFDGRATEEAGQIAAINAAFQGPRT